MADKISCPKCGNQFELTEAISKEIEVIATQKYNAQLNDLKIQGEAREKQLIAQYKAEEQKIEERAKKQAEENLKIEVSDLKAQIAEKSKILELSQQKELEFLQKERAINDKERALELKAEQKIASKEKEMRDTLEAEKNEIVSKAIKQAKVSLSVEMEDLKEQLEQKEQLLESSKKQELSLRKKQHELEEKERTLELETLRRLEDEKQKILNETAASLEEKYRLKDAEKEKQLLDMKKKIDELQRKAEQGSQQAQGEILELDLENRLRAKFFIDDIDPVQKGVKGADVLQTVKTQTGLICGKILWESKRTKAWSDLWIQKAKDNQLAAKADLVVIMSETMPKGVQQFDSLNGVWITDIASAINLAVALRMGIIQIYRERELQIGKQEKMEVVYTYLTGHEFKNRVEAIVGSLVAMREDLVSEKRSFDKIWAKREKQIERVIQNISGMHGDLEGIAGKMLPAIKMLELTNIPENELLSEVEEEI